MFRTATALILFVTAFACVPAGPGLVYITNESSSTDLSPCHSYNVLLEAIQAAINLSLTAVIALPGASNMTLPTITIPILPLTLVGNENALTISGSISVPENRSLVITGWTILGLGATIDVRGTMNMVNCTVSGAVAFQLWSVGAIVIQATKFINYENGGLLVSSWGASLVVSHSYFQDCAFLQNALISMQAASDTATLTPTQLIFDNCIFSNVSTIQALVSISTSGALRDSANQVVFTGCSFHNNPTLLVDLKIADLNVTFNGCEFIGNQGGGVNVAQYNSQLVFASCVWVSNALSLLSVSHLQGQIIVTGGNVGNQLNYIAIEIYNLGSVGECLVLVQDTLFHDTNYTTSASIGSLLTSSYCFLIFSNVSIENWVEYGMSKLGMRTTMINQFGAMQMKNVRITNSGGTGGVLATVYGELVMNGVTLKNVLTSLAFFVGISTTANFTAVEVVGGVPCGIESIQLLGMFFQYSTLIISDLYTRSQSERFLASIMVDQSIAFVTNFTADNPLFNFLFIAHASNITISDLTANSGNCLFIFLFTSSSFAYVDTVSITGVQVTGIGLQTPKSTGSFRNMRITGVVGSWMLRSTAAAVVVSNLLIATSNFTDVLHHIVSSTVVLTNVTVSNSKTGIVSSYSTKISLMQVNFFDCICDHLAIDVSGETLVVTQLVISGYHLTIGFGAISESALVYFSENNWSDLTSDIGVGIEIKDGSLEIRNSQFARCQVGLISATSANVTIENSIFQDGGIQYESLQLFPVLGGILNCANCINVLFSSVQASRMSAKSGGAIQTYSTEPSRSPEMRIESSTFVECSAYSGGAIYIENTYVTISDSTFSNCTATTSGGALYVWTSGLVEVSHSQFANNSATEGGAVKWGLQPVLFLGVVFSANTAVYGPDIASYGVDLRLITDFSGLELVSGNPLPGDLIFELIDQYGQVVSTSTKTQITLQPRNTSQYTGTNYLLGSRGIYNFSTSSFLLTPGLNHTIEADMFSTDPGFTVHVQKLLNWFFRNCTVGEAYQEDECFTCPIGMYSFDPNTGVCSMCPSHISCPGKSGFEVLQGYWRSGWNRTTIYECPISANCLGGSQSECAEGYTGKMCTECDSNTSRVGSVFCLPCNGSAVSALQFLVLLVSIVVIFAALAIFTVHQDRKRMALLKMMITHSQFLMMLLHLKVKLPDVVFNTMIAIKYTTGLSISQLPFACISHSTSTVYIASVVAVLLYFGITICIFPLLSCCFPKAVKKAHLPTILAGAFYVSTPIIVEVLTSLISPVTLDDGKSWLLADMNEPIWTKTHALFTYVLLIPGLILIVFGNALYWLVSLLTRKQGSGSNLFLVSGYQSQFCYWEHIVHFFKCLFIFSIVISVNRQSLFQISCAFLTLLPLIILHSQFQPTAPGYLFNLTILSYLTTAISFGGAAYYINFDTSTNVFTVVYSMTVLGLHGIVLGACLIPMCYRSKKEKSYHEDKSMLHIEDKNLFPQSPSLILIPPCNSVVENSLKIHDLSQSFDFTLKA